MKKSLISIQDFTKDEILHVLEVAKEFEKNRSQKILDGKVIACIFFEPSTRTRLSFETAVNRLGAKVIGFSDDVTEYCRPSHDRGVIEKAIKRLKEQGGTESPLEFCYQRLAGSKAKPVIVVLTDGSWSGQKRAIATSDRCRDVGIDIIAIGFGSADKEFLRRISTISVMTDLDKLVDSFGTIAQELAQSGSASGIKFR